MLSNIKSRLPSKLQTLSDKALVGLGVGAVAVTALAAFKMWSSKKDTTTDDSASSSASSPPPFRPSAPGSIMHLLEFDKSPIIMGCPPLATLSVYEGTPPLDVLRSRLQAVVDANPWMQGRLLSDPKEGVVTWVPATTSPVEIETTSADVEALLAEGHFNLYSHLQSFFCPNGYTALDTDTPLMRFLVITMPNNKFAVLFTLCHTLCDGASYYRLLRSLSTGSAQLDTVETLDMTRVDGYSSLLSTAVSPDQMAFAGSAELVAGMTRNAARRPPHDIKCYEINMEEVARVKAAHKPTPDAPFLSTNDVVSHWFFTGRPYTYCMMAFNLRGRVPGVSLSKAGNFISLPGLWASELKADGAGAVRRAVTKNEDRVPWYGGQDQSAPGKVAAWWNPKWALITNWVAFCHKMTVQGATFVSHFPLGDVKHFSIAGTAIVFKSGDSVRIMIGEEDHVRSDDPMLGKRVY